MVENAELSNQLDVMNGIPADDSSEQEVESLWRQLMIHESFSSSELAEAKAKRIAAEATRQQTEIESVRNTKSVIERMRYKAEKAVEESNRLRDEATGDRSEATAALKQAVATKEQADAQAVLTAQDAVAQAKATIQEAESQAREKIKDSEAKAQKTADGAEGQAKSIVDDATKQADVILDEAKTQSKELVARGEEKAREFVETARASAQGQTTELRRQALREIRSVMGHIQEMGAAATEELETQRILTNVAQMRVTSKRVEGETSDQDDDWISSLGLTGTLDEVAPNEEPTPEPTTMETSAEQTEQSVNNKTGPKRARAKKS